MKRNEQYTRNELIILCGDIEAAGLDLYDLLSDAEDTQIIEYEIKRINKALRMIRYNKEIIIRKLQDKIEYIDE